MASGQGSSWAGLGDPKVSVHFPTWLPEASVWGWGLVLFTVPPPPRPHSCVCTKHAERPYSVQRGRPSGRALREEAGASELSLTARGR